MAFPPNGLSHHRHLHLQEKFDIWLCKFNDVQCRESTTTQYNETIKRIVYSIEMVVVTPRVFDKVFKLAQVKLSLHFQLLQPC